MPKISIITPVYNLEKYLPRCLDSILGQTLRELEVLCINDGSTDGSLAILESYAAQDPRVKVVDLGRNSGVSAARNKALSLAQGEYLGFADGDDYMDRDFYEKLYQLAQESGADIARARVRRVEPDGTATLDDINIKIRNAKNRFLFNNHWQAAIYKTSLVRGHGICFPEECTNSEDIVFLFKCLLASDKLALRDDVFYHYIRHTGSLDVGDAKGCLGMAWVKSAMRAIEIMVDALHAHNLYETDREQYVSLYWQLLNMCFYPIFKNTPDEGKLFCAEKMVHLCKNCKDPAGVLAKPPFSVLRPFLLNAEPRKLADELCKYGSYKQFISSVILSTVRRRVSADTKNL